MPLSKLLKPAISYAADGFVVQKVLGKSWAYNADKLARYPSGSEMLLNGRAPRAGEVMRFPELAEVLKSIARRGPKAFYKGKLAEKIANYVQKMGGWLEKEDLESHQSTWDEPISSDYRGVRVWECPPNGHGLAALMAMNIAEGFDIRGMGFQSADTYHHLNRVDASGVCRCAQVYRRSSQGGRAAQSAAGQGICGGTPGANRLRWSHPAPASRKRVCDCQYGLPDGG